jgi:hypothetical protein
MSKHCSCLQSALDFIESLQLKCLNQSGFISHMQQEGPSLLGMILDWLESTDVLVRDEP